MQPLRLDIDATPSCSLPAEKADYEQVPYSQVTFPDYRHLKRLGRGSYATVVRGHFRGRAVAVKLADRQEDLQNARVLNSFRHENIIHLHAMFYGPQSGLLLELMEGGSLHELMHQNQHIQYFPCHMIGWAQQVLSAVSYLHGHGYVHRDLKPSNMLLNNDFITLKLCDFGTATELKSSMTDNRGSAAWMAPEVFQGKKYDQKCDIFSFGVFLWEMIARKPPFDDRNSNVYSILWQMSQGLRPHKVNCPPILMDIIERCWHDRPALRPDVDEVRDEIDVICAAIYPNRYMPLIDMTTGAQAFAVQPVNFSPNYEGPPPSYPAYLPPIPARSPVPPPIPPPPRVNNGHHRTSSHDFNLFGRPTEPRSAEPDTHSTYNYPTNYGRAVDYHPAVSSSNALPPLPPPHPSPHYSPTPIQPNPADIGWRRSSEPPISDNDSAYGSTRASIVKPKKKGSIINAVGHLFDSVAKRL